MNDKIKEILEMITNKGFKAYVVGGYVRDYLRKIKSIDVDICTNARVKDLMEIFKDYKITSLEYGNILLETKDYLFEITTFRKDIDYINNRKPIIEYVDTLEEDITRRDFTVNSICMDKDGKIIDLLNGKKDLNKKIIRTIGDASFKIKQDSLRILRAIRFASCLNFKIEDSLKKAIKENKDLLKDLSYERKKEELTKIFTSDNKAYGVKLLKELDLLDVLELTNIDNVLRTKDLIGMWSTITINDNYPFTKKEKDLINNINKLLKINGTQICPKADNVTTDDIELAHKNGLRVRLWGVSNEKIMQEVYKFDIDGMTVNFPDKLQHLIENENNCKACTHNYYSL